MSDTPVRKKTTKKSVRKRTKKTAVRARSGASQTRKAPTSLAAQKKKERRAQRILFGGIGGFVVVLAVSVFIGTRDAGEVTITAVLEEQKKDATPEELQLINNVGVQETKTKKIDGGLVPSGVPVQQSESEVVSKQATSSPDATASSSASVAATTTEEQTVEENTSANTIATSSAPADT